MPGVNWIKATREIFRMDQEVKVIFISADVRVREDAIKARAAMFVQKPASVKEILNAVESVGAKWQNDVRRFSINNS